MYLGEVERHYLKCPLCGDRADLVDHRCMSCGARAVFIVWEFSSPELALISRKRRMGT